MIVAVSKQGEALIHASDRLKADKEVVKTAVNRNGHALEHASEDLRADKGIVLLAVQQNPLALEYADKELRTEVLSSSVADIAHELDEELER
mgnify:FL=1